MTNSSNPVVRYLAARAEAHTTGDLGKNSVYVKKHMKCDQAPGGHEAALDARVAQIQELLRVLDGLDHITPLNEEDTREMLKDICTY